MKKVVLTVVLLIAILFGLDWSFGFFLKENRNIKVANAFKGGLEYDVLFHGPCEPLFTIDASVVDSITGLKTYNYALRHTDFADNFLHLYLYLKQNKAPKQVYLYVTPESFDYRFNSFHTYRFAPYLDDSVVSEVVKECDPDFYRYSSIPYMQYAYYNGYKNFDAVQGGIHFKKQKSDPYFKDGFVPHPDNKYAEQKDGYIAPEHLLFAGDKIVIEESDSSLYYDLYEKRQTFNWEKQRVKHLLWIVELCKKKGIDLVFYESTPYSKAIADQPNRTRRLNQIDSLASANGVRFITMENLSISNDKTNFVCPLILSVKGTKEFLPAFSDTITKYFPQ